MEHGHRECMIASGMATFRSPLATLTQAAPPAVLAPPINNVPHADWRGLPDDAVASVLDRLPVLDLFRLGYLFSPRWLDIWRAKALFLHDRQFATPPIAADDVADAITNVLELHVGHGVQFVAVQGGEGGDGGGEGEGDGGEGGDGGNEVAGADGDDLGVIVNPGERVVGPGALGGVGADEGVISDDEYDIYGNEDVPNGGYEIGRVYSFRVETTRWRPDHLDRWCAALQRGRARQVFLANLFTPGHPHLPPGIRDCTSLLGLHVFFFTVEADDIDPLARARLRSLGLYGCAAGPGMIQRALHPGSEIQMLIIHYGAVLQGDDDFAVAATRLRHLALIHNEVRTVTVDKAIQLRQLYAMRTSKLTLTINGAPSLRAIFVDLFSTVLEIDGIVIKAGMVEQPPQMRSVRRLILGVNHTDSEMGRRVPRQIEQILRSFPCVETLEILRDDKVTVAEGLLLRYDEHIYEGDNFFDGLESINKHLKRIYLKNFRGGKYELALIKAILDKAKALTLLKMEYSPGSFTRDTLNHLDLGLAVFRLFSPNDALRGNGLSIIRAED